VTREGAEPAVDDVQAAVEAPPVHDEAEAPDADARPGGEDVRDRADEPVAAAAFLRGERLARVEVEEGLIEQAAPPRRENRRPPGVAEGEEGEDGQQDGVREIADSVPAVPGRPIRGANPIPAAGLRASAFGRPAAEFLVVGVDGLGRRGWRRRRAFGVRVRAVRRIRRPL